MRHTHDLAGLLTLSQALLAENFMSPEERRHVFREAALEFLACVRPPVFEAAVRRLLENPVAEEAPPEPRPARPDPKPPVPRHPAGKIQPPSKRRVAP